LSQCRIELSAGNDDETESREEPARRRRKQGNVPNAALPRQFQRRGGEPLPQPLPAPFGRHRHGSQQTRGTVDLDRGASDDLAVLSSNERRLDVPLKTGDRQRTRLQQRHDFGQI
jgi:hypothetical protein